MYTTQTRTLDNPINKIEYIWPPDSEPFVLAFGAEPSIVPSQATYSFRTSGPQIASDEELIKDWITVQRNGFSSPSRYDTGHEFWTSKTSHRFSHPRWLARWKHLGTSRGYRGPLVPTASTTSSLAWGSYPGLSRLSQAEKDKWGPHFISETIPTAPSANLATFLGELGQLPKVFGAGLVESRANAYRGLGSEYLNVQFGWIPFLRDIQAATQALLHQTELLRQYSRDSGRVVRRRREAPSITTSSTLDLGPMSGRPIIGARTEALNGYFDWSSQAHSVSQEDIRSENYVFSGAYSYHLPIPDGFFGKMERFEAEANRLLGTRINPSVLWELSPWSWLIDWHGQLGDVFANASALAGDELVLRYGYLMRQTVQQRTYRVPSLRFNDGRETGPISHTLRRVTKERVRANPYGFTLAPSQYSVKQWAILGALGLTKAPRVLH